jgi:serine protease Do
MTKQSMILVGLLLIAPLATSAQVLAAPSGAASFNTLASASGAFEKIADQVSPSVVQIFVNGYGFTRGPSGVLTKQAGTASGTVIDADGLIVTNAHVVTRATRVQVLVPAAAADSRQAGLALPQGVKLDATVIGIDTATDLAVLKIPAHGLRPLELGDSSQLKQGQLVLALGSPLGLGNTVTMGVVSAVARQLDADDVPAYIQTDAPINPGNSGGPLVDTEGRVVGINTMILSQSGGSEGVGLAIPSDTVRYIAGQLRANGRVRRVVMGVAVETVSPTMAAALKLPRAWGVMVSDIDPDGPAAHSDLRVGDVILSMDGKRTANVREFALHLYPHPSGSTLDLGVQRGAEELKIQAGVIERPDDPRSVLDLVRPDRNLVPELDILGVDLDEKLAAAFHSLRQPNGVLVAAMSADALPPADRFQPGDVIHAVNRKPVHSLAELRQAVAGLKDGDPVVVQIERGGIFTFLGFEID